MGLIADILYPNTPDTTRCGLSTRYDEVCITAIVAPSEPSPKHPAVNIIYRQHLDYHHAEPDISTFPLAKYLMKKTRWMAGGRFIYSSDSRFRQISKYPVPLHDRTESRINPFIVQDLSNLSVPNCTEILSNSNSPVSIAISPTAHKHLRTRLIAYYIRHPQSVEFLTIWQIIDSYKKSIHRYTHTATITRATFQFIVTIKHPRTLQNYSRYANTPKEAYTLAYRELRTNCR